MWAVSWVMRDMPKLKNREIVLASRPVGEPTLDNFSLIEEDIEETPERGLVLKTLFLSRSVHAWPHGPGQILYLCNRPW